MKRALLLFFSVFISCFASATHIVGGSLTYEHLGGSTYRVTLKLYRDCSPGNAAFPATATILVRRPNGGTFTPSRDISIPFPGATQLQPTIDTCAVDPGICVQEAIYTKIVTNLPPNPGGYHMYFQTCCRNASLNNIQNPLSAGESFYAYIPDNSVYLTNSSPSWVNFPPIFVCQGNPVNFDHSATDSDGDSLVYSLYTPYNDNAPTFPGNVATFTPVVYQPGFGTTNPLGGPPGSLTISSSGLLNGIPPNIGQFVVGVMCTEYRNGVKLSSIIRDFQFNVVFCPPLAQANFTPASVCSGSTVSFTNTSDPADSYFWDFGDPGSTSDTSYQANPPGYTYPGLGPYTATLIINYGTPCADTSMQTVQVSWVNSNFTASNDSACVGGSLTFTDGSTTSPNTSVTGWDWSFGDGNTSASQNPTYTYGASGTYNVTLVTTSGTACTDTMVMSVIVNAPPIALAGNDTTSCTNNPAITLGGSVLNAAGGTWTGGGTFSPNANVLNPTYNPSASEISAGFAVLTLTTTGNGLCSSATDTITLVFTSGPTANAGSDIFVCKDTSYVPVTGSVTVAGGGQWSSLGSGTFSNPNSVSTNYLPSSADTSAGTVTLVLTTTSNGTCFPSTDTVQVIFTPLPNLSITSANDTSCATNTFAVNASTTTGQGVWGTLGTGSFSPSDTLLNSFYTPGPADDAAGFVDLVFATTNNGGCQVQRDTIRVNIIPSPTASFSSTVVCPDQSTQFTDASTAIGGVVSWNWDFGDGTPGSSSQNPSHVYSTGGVHNATLIVTSANGCIDTIMQAVNNYFFPVADFGSVGYCLDDGTTFFDSSSVAGGTIASWQWDFGDAGTSNLQNPLHVYASSGTYPVELIVESNQGCADTVIQNVLVNPSPDAAFTYSPSSTTILQNVNFTDQSFVNIVSWYWDFGDTTFSTDQNPVHSYQNPGTYPVTLVITDNNGCVDTISNEVIIFIPPVVPTGFSPNGDGVNDYFLVRGGPYKELDFRIYNNWGELIFVSNNDQLGWDGTRSGVPQPVGVYVYTVKAITVDNTTHEISGDVTLLR